jgi:8-oxo-dGTP pyrophosphatase MutT (NUDIX family)
MASPRSAAAVVLVRENPELEVFWVRRAPQMTFQGGFYAFPGGQLDDDSTAGSIACGRGPLLHVAARDRGEA